MVPFKSSCRFAALVAGVVCLLPGLAGADAMMLWRGAPSETARAGQALDGNDATPALAALLAGADEALGRGPYSVVDKTGFRGDDIHDYHSQAPYWWPDPETPDGLPYVRRDGQTNPEKYGDALDSRRRHDMSLDLAALSRAGHFTEDRRYLEHAALLLRTWFIAPATRMNPNMRHAQSIPGRTPGRGAGIIDSRAFVYAVDAALLLRDEGLLGEDELAALRSWFGDFAAWLEASENGRDERAARNNHGTFYDFQLAAFHWFAGNRQAAEDVISRFCAVRIEQQVEADGRQPHELARTRPFHYSVFNLQAMINMALLARRMGLDTNDPDCSIEAGIERGLAFVAERPDSGADWPENPTDPAWRELYELLRVYDHLAGGERFRDALARSGDAFGSSVVNLLLNASPEPFDLRAIERPRILRKAAAYLDEEPLTVTAFRAERSAGGPHDFYSEGDYWWPDPDNPGGPYVRRDGFSNPDNFVAHRRAMVRLSEIVGTLVSAHVLTGEPRYASKARQHLFAWFVDDATRMNPSLLYGQAISGRVTGRSIGIIDTIHLVEVARATRILGESGALPAADLGRIRGWFAEYLDWLVSHPYGQAERQHPNNHGVCWSMQAAAFADLVGRGDLLEWVRKQFREVYLGEMMAADGSFPAELDRTKPYGYSLFVLDAMATVARLASTPADDLWAVTLPDGRGMAKAMEFLFPYVQDKSAWPYGRDVLYWDEWPVRQPSLLFAGLRYDRPDYLGLWRGLEPDPVTPEVLRTLPVRHPLLWLDDGR